jgi:hypothetical protein
MLPPEERIDLPQRVRRELERHKEPFVRPSRIIAASNISMSGLPALSFCFTCTGYQVSMKSSSPAAFPLPLGIDDTG